MQTYEEAMAEAVGLGLMTEAGKATDRCQCSECRCVFSTEGNFDRHRNRDGCREPSTVGLIQHPRGWWLQPGPAGGHPKAGSGVRRGRGSDAGAAGVQR